MQQFMILPAADVPKESEWLRQQSCPVIVYGENDAMANADVIVDDRKAAEVLAKRIQTAPLTAMTLVQVLRSTEQLPPELGLDVESLAYSTLQAGNEFSSWLKTHESITLAEQSGPVILLERKGSEIEALLNRSELRNSITVEMRDAWVEMLELLELDQSITRLTIRGQGPCFSTGGELAEFGSAPDPATAHWVRSIRSPARMMQKLRDRITCHVHGACIGSGIELPAFASRVVAHRKTYFQLPELSLGLIPGAGGTVSIANRIGRQRTAWLVLSGRRITAQKALEWGLVDDILD
ncbi:enoyl-CoA hydratase/isomerase family protein [Pseudomaricurvus sp.]|uniref:enoyl-CoA hydratase/isomerase family protein n=1 Tax=Pseudomaricurvus sp. TaxID=2004510 RepID=UPI003F6D8D02